ncbi:hypothetical protein EZV62_002895 [Acer yangbiense]|uniref:Serine-threonine/tyrosine-protein kinase catalytic domain-containing protein n=1 Tax=Acer yangbiense TaxID=1000413 RepID=A0A5C7J0Y4_9ROSI|nr:hypothetical protein EZV62_002895 [Acer yangbiense]
MKVVVVIESEMVTDRAMEDEFLETSTMHNTVSGTQSSSIGIKGTIGYVAPVTTDNNNVENFERLHGEERVRMEECLVGALRIGVLCSMESPADRMEMTDVVAKLCAIKENFLSRRIRDVRPSSQLT